MSTHHLSAAAKMAAKAYSGELHSAVILELTEHDDRVHDTVFIHLRKVDAARAQRIAAAINAAWDVPDSPAMCADAREA